jgi:hypothetical protein
MRTMNHIFDTKPITWQKIFPSATSLQITDLTNESTRAVFAHISFLLLDSKRLFNICNSYFTPRDRKRMSSSRLEIYHQQSIAYQRRLLFPLVINSLSSGKSSLLDIFQQSRINQADRQFSQGNGSYILLPSNSSPSNDLQILRLRHCIFNVLL